MKPDSCDSAPFLARRRKGIRASLCPPPGLFCRRHNPRPSGRLRDIYISRACALEVCGTVRIRMVPAPCPQQRMPPHGRPTSRTGSTVMYFAEGDTTPCPLPSRWSRAAVGLCTMRNGDSELGDTCREAAEGADYDLDNESGSGGHIYFARFARPRVAVYGLYGSVRRICGSVRRFRMVTIRLNRTRPDHPGNAERGKQRSTVTGRKSEPFCSKESSPSADPDGYWPQAQGGCERLPNPVHAALQGGATTMVLVRFVSRHRYHSTRDDQGYSARQPPLACIAPHPLT